MFHNGNKLGKVGRTVKIDETIIGEKSQTQGGLGEQYSFTLISRYSRQMMQHYRETISNRFQTVRHQPSHSQ